MAIQIMTTIWKKNIPPAQKLILLALGDFAKVDGTCFPSFSLLASKTGYTERLIYKHLAEFVAKGWITIENQFHKNGRKKNNLYTINLKIIEQLPSFNRPNKKQKKGSALHDVHTRNGGDPALGSGWILHHVQVSKDNRHVKPSIDRAKLALPAIAFEESERLFEEVWAILPKKKKKKEAKEYWLKKKLYLKADQILNAAKAYQIYARSLADSTYILQAGNWFIKERWEDELVSNNNNNPRLDEERKVFAF